MTTREGFKETEIGDIPVEWEYEELGNYLIQIRNGTTNKQNQQEIGYPVSRIETISNEFIDKNKVRHLAELTDTEKEKFLLDEGDILLSHINSEKHLGKAAIYEGEPENLVHGMNLLRLKVNKDEVDETYLYNLFKMYRNKGRFIAIASRAVNQSSINQGEMKALKIPVPPLPEQKAVAQKLTVIRNAIEQTQAVIEATEALKKSMMKHLFTYGPVPTNQTDQVKLKEAEVGLVPEGWEKKKLGDISDIKSGGTPSRGNAEYWENGNISWVKTGEVNYSTIIDTEEKITQKGLENSSANLFPKGTILIAMYGQGVTRGRVGKLGVKASTNQACAAFLNLKSVTNDYLFYALQYEYERLRMHAHGANQKNLSGALLKQFEIYTPDHLAQKSIVDMLHEIDQKMTVEKDRLLSLEKLFDSALSELMFAKIRVN